METPNHPAVEKISAKPISIKIIALDRAGMGVAANLILGGLSESIFAVVSSDARALTASPAAEKIHLETENGSEQLLEEPNVAKFKALCQGVQVVFIIAALGRGSGATVAPVIGRAAKEAGALVLAFVMTPFDCEGSGRQSLAQGGIEKLKAVADGVICLPNQKALKLTDENTSLEAALQLANELLAGAVLGIWNLIRHEGLIELDFAELLEMLRNQHNQSVFAVAEAAGPARSREVMDKLLAHPLLDGGEALSQADGVLVSLMGGPDLTIAEINRVMEQIHAKCARAQVLMGAAVEESFRERLALTLIAARTAQSVEIGELASRGVAEELDAQLLKATTGRPGSRFVPPAPSYGPEEMRQMLSRQKTGAGRGDRKGPKLRQGQLPLEIISKGRFDKSEPTIHKGEDLDVPTYIRRGVPLN